MRIAIEYTPAVRQRAGVGRYTRSLVNALLPLAGPDDRFLLWYAGFGGPRYVEHAPTGAGELSMRRIPLSERWLTIGWQRIGAPIPLEWFTGPADVAHSPDFVAPPSRAPVIATVHDLSYLVAPQYSHPNLRHYLTTAVPRTLARAARIVAVSEATKRDLIHHYDLDEKRVVVIHNGVDRYFQPAAPAEQQRTLERFRIRQPYFLIVGTIEPRKNHLTLLEAAAIANARCLDLLLVVAGRPGWLSQPIVSAINEAASVGTVHYLGGVDDTVLPALYTGSVGVVYPSWYEGFGLPVIEAMASGTAVIASDRGALAEVAGDAAMLVPPDDPEAIAEAMIRLHDDATLRERLVNAGRRRSALFSWDSAAEAHLRLYREVGRR